MRNLEHKLQVACVRWFRLQYPDKILFAIPNGGKRNIITARFLKDEGVLAGVPDLFLAEPSGGYAGLFIEMKVGRNTLTNRQKIIIRQLKKAGYKVDVVRSLDQFIDVVNSYLGQEVKIGGSE